MQTIKLSEINERCRSDAAGFVQECEQEYTKSIEQVACRVLESKKPIILLNGPSSSGKTTTARRLEQYLDQMGVETHAISMDDYYYSRDAYDVPVDEEGQPDLESPLCMDLPMLGEHLKQLAAGEAIEVPHFDFMTRSRTDERTEVRLGKNEVAVIEGIHALNEVIVGGLKDSSIGVYMAVGSQMQIAPSEYLAPHKLRFIRRAVRDRNFRNSPVTETIGMWRSIRRGERLYVHPYTSNAVVHLNTYLPYEDCYLAGILTAELAGHQQMLEQAGLSDVADILGQIEQIKDRKLIPEDSIMREFIG
ncbi:MAG: uridine kinase [Butyricicoccaceae bacterium]